MASAFFFFPQPITMAEHHQSLRTVYIVCDLPLDLFHLIFCRHDETVGPTRQTRCPLCEIIRGPLSRVSASSAMFCRDVLP